MSNNKVQLVNIRKLIARHLLKLTPDAKKFDGEDTATSSSSIGNYKRQVTNPRKSTLLSLITDIEFVYKTYYYDEDKVKVETMRSRLDAFNQDLQALGVTAKSNGVKYIEPDENICDQLIPYCIDLIENDRLFVPYWLSYRPENQKKLSFPPYLSPSRMTDQVIIGREKECEEIHRLLNEHDEPIYLDSMAGLGKTSVVQEYTKMYTDRLDLMIHVPSGSKNVCYDVLNELAPERLNDSGEEDSSNHYASILYGFAEEMKDFDNQVLLIIDNISSAEQLSSVKKLKPLCDIGWKILVTTRVTNKSIKKQTVYEIERLSEENCLRLFEYYYLGARTKQALSPDEKKELHNLLDKLSYHTYLIELVARIGEFCGISISELAATLVEEETDTLNLDKILDARVYTTREQENRKIRSIISTLLDMSQLDEMERRVLGYFTLLPDVPISQKLLIQWMSDKKDLLPIPLATVLADLCERGWLLLENADERMYKCHSLVQSAFNLNEESRESFDCLPFIKNATNYLNFPHDGMERTDIFQNLPILSTVLTRYTDETRERYQLIKQYLSCCINFSCCPLKSLDYAEEMMKLFDKFYSEDSLEKIICQHINNETYFEVASERGKEAKVREMRRKTAEEAENCYDQKPLLCIRINQKYASSLKRNGQFAESLELLNKQEQKIKNVLDQKDLPNVDEWKYALFRNYELKGIFSNSYYMNESNSLTLKDVLAIRKDYLKTGEELLTKDSYKLRFCYNDLGMTYIYMYDDPDEETANDPLKKAELLEKADFYLNRSYNMAINRYGENSIRCISPTKNLASSFKRRGDFEKAKEFAERAYKLRKSKPNSEADRGLMVDARFLSGIYLDEYRDQTKKDPLLLEIALNYVNEALEISELLHAGEENLESIENHKRIKEIKKELDDFDNSEN